MAFLCSTAHLHPRKHGVAGQGSLPVHAETEPAPETPIRKTTLTVNYTAHEWWLRWSDNDIACRLVVEHEGVPISGEVLTFCGKTVHTTWLKTTPCDLNQVGGDMTQCPGMYFFEAGSWQASRDGGGTAAACCLDHAGWLQ